MLAVKKLMPESFLNFRLRGTTLNYEELLPTTRQKNVDTSAPMEIGMAAKDGSKEVSRLQRKLGSPDGPSWNAQRCTGGKGAKDSNREGKSSWQKGNGKNGGKGTEKGGKDVSRICWTCGKAND